MTRRIAVVSDLHVGSIFGLMPPGFTDSSDRLVILNRRQGYLWECWTKGAVPWLLKDPLDAVVFNGDLVDGGQRAQRGTELCLPIVEDQVYGAEAIIEPFVRAANCPVFFVQGSEYHDGKAAQLLDMVAEKFGTAFEGLGTGRFSREVLDLDVNGVDINFAHGISVSTGFYRATPLDREGIFSALAGKSGKMPKADVVVRSHAHYFCHLEHASKHIVLTPCWQLQTRFMRRNSVYRMLPDLGVVLLEIDGQAKLDGGDPCVVRKKLFDLPAIVPVKL